MLRAVVDVNVLVSATLTPGGTPHRLVERWLEGLFELVISPALLAELERVLARPEVADRTDRSVIEALSTSVREGALLVEDPATHGRLVPRDPADDYLVALARTAGAHAIVTGDRHLLELEGLHPPVLTPAAFVEALERLD